MSREEEYQNHRTRPQERDLVVAPNEYAYVSDQTKGNINVHVGPLKTSLAGTDQLVLFDYKNKRFMNSTLPSAIQTFATAPEGWYIVLKNPAIDGNQPVSGKAENLRDLAVGRKINIPGPESFALWPGQMTKVLKGHILRSNQYLVVRVYDEQSAQENWSKTVIKKAGGEDADPEKLIDDANITMGKLFIIKGTEVSFYIPPTGVEVVAEGNNYVRDAVTLERLEYCILKDENGEKRYVKGPDVVFPEPTEVFLKKNGTRKFKAIELSPISGLYIKVIADYGDHKVGDELFITGKDQMIYFPREEHAIMKYGDKEKHYATAIPAGEARYVLNRLTGEIRLEKGPSMFLPNPIEEVLVKRILSIRDVQRWFPGNQEAIQYNQMLEAARGGGKENYITADSLDQSVGATVAYASSRVYEDDDWNAEQAKEAMLADVMQRGTSYTPPRTITIDSKYEGAVVIDIWTGYAVKVKSKTKEPRVVYGPKTIMLEYDESLEYMSLSTGTPKSDDKPMDTAYLRVLNNKISDVFYATTVDNCEVAVKVSYRVNFEGDLSKAFDVENYVKFLTDHMRSLGKAVIKNEGIENFYANPHGIIRDAFLGKKDDETGEREGRFFAENEMRVYEVEVLQVKIGDSEIEQMLVRNQNNIVKQSLVMAQLERETKYENAKQELTIEKANAVLKTALNEIENQKQKTQEQLKLELARSEKEKAVAEVEKVIAALQEEVNDVRTDAQLARDKKELDQEHEEAQRDLALKLELIAKEVQAVKDKGSAISPQLIAALQALGDKQLAAALSENMSIWGHLGGKSVVEVFQNLFAGTKLEGVKDLLMKDYVED
jgi:major vault protein